MENVSHTLAGLALARCGLGRTTPLATTALVAGANLPDVDLLWKRGARALRPDRRCRTSRRGRREGAAAPPRRSGRDRRRTAEGRTTRGGGGGGGGAGERRPAPPPAR